METDEQINLSGTRSIGLYLTEGGDRRIDIMPDTAKNKYFMNPYDFKGLLNRGSCTCSTLNPETLQMLERREPPSIGDFGEIRTRLKRLLNFEGEDRFDVFLAPSGSDLTYYPILFAQLLHPERDPVSLVSCPEELGSGTIKAASGQYFMDKTQIRESVPSGGLLFGKAIETVQFAARDTQGQIIKHKQLIEQSIQSINDRTKLVYLVVGSKSGIENDMDVIDPAATDALWTVDLCQFRNKKVLINELLYKGATVMLTGSKFYQSPPFCGALLVPKSLGDRIRRSKIHGIEPFQSIFCREDIPPTYHELRNQFENKPNWGLAQRWLCALHEMESYDHLPFGESDGMIQIWNTAMTEAIQASKCLEIMPSQELTNDSIISFRAKNKGTYLTPDEMQQLFQGLVQSKHEGFTRYNRLFIGQPVRYGEKAFLRIALGSFNVRKLLERGKDLTDDLHVIHLIDEYAQKISK